LFAVGLLAACAGREPVSAELAVDGMVCESCAQAIQSAVARLDGVESCEVDVAQGRANVRFRPDRVELSAIEAAIDRLGYEAAPLSAAR
jgi:Cu+-exporting ATPase